MLLDIQYNDIIVIAKKTKKNKIIFQNFQGLYFLNITHFIVHAFFFLIAINTFLDILDTNVFYFAKIAACQKFEYIYMLVMRNWKLFLLP